MGRRRRISGPTVMGTDDITAFLFADLVQGVPQVSLGEHRVLLDKEATMACRCWATLVSYHSLHHQVVLLLLLHDRVQTTVVHE